MHVKIANSNNISEIFFMFFTSDDTRILLFKKCLYIIESETRFWRNFGWALRPTSTHKWARVTTDRFCQNLFFCAHVQKEEKTATTTSDLATALSTSGRPSTLI